MLEKLIGILAGWIIMVISTLGYGGIVLLMGIESACIPLPSEVIMPFAGYLVHTGQLTLWGVALAGAVGCVLGSIPAYYLGAYGGRTMIEKYGRYMLISQQDLHFADKAFEKHGEIIIFIGRLLPVVRTFIAFPAGIARMNMARFVIYTFSGSLIWCFLLAFAGMKLGEHWQTLGVYFHEFHYVIAVVGLVFAVWYVRRHFKHLK
ncbi:DedA family protein [Methyloradius palustris]|uniref:Alkaline phosphatase n=1 Tax=Methyloradius palustris TaxID=2778876 RepID=A0A8D5G344_9PROT|nr:DedA family protein [Methyloradius palustris]BCM24840.1 alkaline phosphatase [Methyloradius palustris]